ncbi:MAG: hypothetical protein ACREDK_05585 [Thermoplasmata archaeon]
MDLAETPAVDPLPTGGDERAGLFVAGGLLLAVGWGMAVVLNLLVHALAPSGGIPFGPIRIVPAIGPYAWLTLALGAFTGLMGVAFVRLARSTAKGPLVLPGEPY